MGCEGLNVFKKRSEGSVRKRGKNRTSSVSAEELRSIMQARLEAAIRLEKAKAMALKYGMLTK